MLKALGRLLRAEGFKVSAFSSGREFAAAYRPVEPSCLVLDVAMPGMSGMELQERLAREGAPLPVVFLTGHGDIPMSVRAIKAGAVDFLTKPVDRADLIRAVRAALERSAAQAAERAELAELSARLATLTPREREVLAQVITGRLNKQIADALGTTEQTIKVHRMRVMTKMGLPSAVELARAAQRLGVEPAV
ncbi:MAG: response regulator transcription factor [Verrucomicrobiae bacterium]|nr:response regulator transcription factor [Verrucomicrobiae bacterium]